MSCDLEGANWTDSRVTAGPFIPDRITEKDFNALSSGGLTFPSSTGLLQDLYEVRGDKLCVSEIWGCLRVVAIAQTGSLCCRERGVGVTAAQECIEAMVPTDLSMTYLPWCQAGCAEDTAYAQALVMVGTSGS